MRTLLKLNLGASLRFLALSFFAFSIWGGSVSGGSLDVETNGEVYWQAAQGRGKNQSEQNLWALKAGLEIWWDAWGARLEGLQEEDLHYRGKSYQDLEGVPTPRSEVRWATIKYEQSQGSLELGRQEIILGRSNYFQVADMVTPVDFQQAVVTDKSRYRTPLDALRIRYTRTAWDLDFGLIQDDRLNQYPGQNSLWYQPEQNPCNLFEAAGQACQVVPDQTEQPATYQGYLRLRAFLGAFDFSLMHFEGYEREPSFGADFVILNFKSLLEISQTRQRVPSTVATFSYTWDKHQWDIELRRDFQAKRLNLASEAPMFQEPHNIDYGLLAWRYPLFDGDLSSELYGRYISDYQKGQTQDRSQSFFMIDYSKETHNQRYKHIFRQVVGIENKDGLLHLEESHRWTDQLHFQVGADWIWGKDTAPLGRYRQHSRVFLGMKYHL